MLFFYLSDQKTVKCPAIDGISHGTYIYILYLDDEYDGPSIYIYILYLDLSPLYLSPVMDGLAENIANFLHKTRKFTFRRPSIVNHTTHE